ALAALIGEVIGWFRHHPGHEALKRLFTELVHQAIAGLGAAVLIPEELTEMQTAMSRLGETWKRQYLAEGEARGRAEGEAKGKAKAFILLAEQRFGPLPQALRDRVESADAPLIETWLGRLLAATSLETLFDAAN
ncbi:MAG: hypothetical protein QOJ54_1802, partial [Aliidongia sp.]|nr:hypothetical protein [Aliidongia sp.]